MKIKTLATVAIGAAALVMGSAPLGGLGFMQASAQEAVRPEVGKYLKEASAAIKSGKYKDALAKVQEASGVAGRNANENYMIEAMRAAAASGAGDADTLAKSFEALKGMGKLSAAQQLQYEETIALTYSRSNDNAKAMAWADRYFKEGGNSPAMKQVQMRAQFMSGDTAAIVKDTTAGIAADERAGRAPSLEKLNLLLSAAQNPKHPDPAAESLAVEKMLNYYPTPKLWAQVLGQITRKPGFSDRFALDVLRLKLATGNMNGAEDYVDMAQLAAAAGFPEEGKTVVEKGMAANVLGQGADAAHTKRLLDFLVKKVALAKAGQVAAEKAARDSRDGMNLVNLGLAEVFRGQSADGIQLIKDGIDKDNITHPEDAKLYLGLAEAMSGNAAKAQAIWRGVRGNDGVADLAHLWIIQSRKR